MSTLGTMVKANGRRASFAAALVLSGLVLVGCGDEQAAQPTQAPAGTRAPAAQTTPATAATPAGSPAASPVASPAAGAVASPVASPVGSPAASPVAEVGGTSQGVSSVPTSATLPQPPGA
ncbi:MAG: hypothetical protein M3Q71_09220 [Chloroflexota bacterium]|nr:hypothetical protein [Chloroflexota bacterium]